MLPSVRKPEDLASTHCTRCGDKEVSFAPRQARHGHAFPPSDLSLELSSPFPKLLEDPATPARYYSYRYEYEGSCLTCTLVIIAILREDGY